MVFDEALAARIRDVLAARPALSERKMFGGIAFMRAGEEDLSAWVEAGADYAASLLPKPK